MTIHIGATPDQIAETVLLPGDPYRATWRAGAGRFDRFRSFANRRGAAGGSARKKLWRYGGNRAACSF